MARTVVRTEAVLRKVAAVRRTAAAVRRAGAVAAPRASSEERRAFVVPLPLTSGSCDLEPAGRFA